MDNLLKNIKELADKLRNTWELLRLEEKQKRATEGRKKLEDPGIWKDPAKAAYISKGVSELEKEIGDWEKLKKELEDLSQFVTESGEMGEDSLLGEAEAQYKELESRFKQMEFVILFSGQYDEGGAILSIHAGTGGVDAQDWAQMLERMFLRFAERRGFRAEIADRTYGNEAGIKSATIAISGRFAYGWLKSENGVHRLVRISPFDAEAMRHTSFALVEVIPELPETAEIEIKDEEIRIDVFRSSGPGGQSVNTTDSAVRIVHLPTNISVSCQTERSQKQNRENAMKILKSKLFKLKEEERAREELKMRGEAQKAEWGKQIRSYVFQPYQMVKDHRTEHETADVRGVMDGELDGFVLAYLKSLK